jgi:hypothetical protein
MEKEVFQSRTGIKSTRTSEVAIFDGESRPVKVFTFSKYGSGETHVELIKINKAGRLLSKI